MNNKINSFLTDLPWWTPWATTAVVFTSIFAKEAFWLMTFCGGGYYIYTVLNK